MILDRGTFFDHGQQDHAITETAPGHATILSGREPAGTGIVDNETAVEDPSAPLLGGNTGPGASPRRFRGSALYDWMRESDAGLRALSVSRKDRAAILLVGRARVPVFWWSRGRFTTSRYFADTLPAWVRSFNDRRPACRLAGKKWDLLLSPSAYGEADSEPYENGGRDVTFPHRIPWLRAADELENYPWIDSLTSPSRSTAPARSAWGAGRSPICCSCPFPAPTRSDIVTGPIRGKYTTISCGSIAGSGGSSTRSPRRYPGRGPWSCSPPTMGCSRFPSE